MKKDKPNTKKDIFEKMKLIRSHGRIENNEGYFSTTKTMDYIQLGYNYRMSSLSASLLLSQIKKINEMIEMRRKKAKYYNHKLLKIKNVKIPVEPENSRHVYQMYTIQLENKTLREKLQKRLSKAGIMSKIYFEPVHLKTFYSKKYNYKEEDLPKTEEISKKVLSIPIYPTIRTNELKKITEEIINICG